MIHFLHVNVVLQNRNHYAQLPYHESATGGKVDSNKTSAKPKASRGDRIVPVGDGALKLAVKDHQLEGVEIGEMRKRFRLRFVRLNGILFTKTRYCVRVLLSV